MNLAPSVFAVELSLRQSNRSVFASFRYTPGTSRGVGTNQICYWEGLFRAQASPNTSRIGDKYCCVFLSGSVCVNTTWDHFLSSVTSIVVNCRLLIVLSLSSSHQYLCRLQTRRRWLAAITLNGGVRLHLHSMQSEFDRFISVIG